MDNKGQTHECRALLDSASQMNFISKNLADRLGLKLQQHTIPINGISNTRAANSSHLGQIQLASRFGDYRKHIICSVLQHITGPLPVAKIRCEDWQLPTDIVYADPQFNLPRGIDLLLGATVFFDILCPEQRFREGHPTLQKTRLGWILAGCIPAHSVAHHNVNQTSLLLRNDTLESQVERFWLQEELMTTPRSKEDIMCEEHFTNHTTRDETGRFIVRLPLNKQREELGESIEHAKRCFGYTERRLEKHPTVKKEYVNFMDEYLELGHMEPVDSWANSQVAYYMPHHSVIKQSSSTTKLRVVFNASAKTSSSLSLNDIMMIGPCVQQSLIDIVLRFRMHRYVLSADVEKMYRQIVIHEDDRDLQRIVWRRSPDQPLEIYRMTRVTYGTAAAPFLATRCLLQLACDGQQTHPRAADVIKQDFYVDDLLTGVDTIDDAIQLQRELTSLLNTAGFNIRKWRANHMDIMDSIPEELHETAVPCNLDLQNDMTRTLGLIWHPENDILQYNVTSHENSNWTKRTVLANVASIFDPLGLQESQAWWAGPLWLSQCRETWPERISKDYRPISPLPNTTDDFSFLTPGHFLVGEPLISFPEPDCPIGTSSRSSRWQLIQRCRQQIWKRWYSDYLCQMQQRTKWKFNQPNLQTGMLVLLKEDNLPPLIWSTGVIVDVHPGSDGLVRVVTVRTPKGVYKRPVNKLCAFPVES